MLTISKLYGGYGDLPVLKDVSIDLEPGSITVLMGPNGAGKSTLLKSIFNLADVTAGSIEFLEEPITGLPTHSLIELGIAYVPQGKINFGTLSVEDNLLIGAYHISDAEVIAANLEQVYDEFPVLKHKRNEYAFSLSGGQQQMLAIGRALMNLPKLLLLDEPSLGLSPKLVKQTFKTLGSINE